MGISVLPMNAVRQQRQQRKQFDTMKLPTSGGTSMATMTIRNIPDDVYRALKVKAALHNRSAEAEVRQLLEDQFGTQPDGEGFKEALLTFARAAQLSEAELKLFERDKTPHSATTEK
jgi:plasmid stability protein